MAKPDNGLLVAIASHPDCKRLRLTLESLAKWGPTALAEFAGQLGIDPGARAPPDPPARRARTAAVYAVREDPVPVHDPPDTPLDVPHPWRTWRRRD